MSSSFPPRDPFDSGNSPQHPFGSPPQSPFGSPPQPPYGEPPLGQPPYGQPPRYAPQSSLGGPRTSPLAVLSLLLGTFAFVFACCCFPVTLPAALVSVVMGHIALIQINRAGSNVSGKALAAIGLVTGYLGVLLSGGVMAAALLAPEPKPDVATGVPTASSNLDAAENKIRTDADGIAHGNTDEAKALAKAFAELMQTLRDELFTKREGGISLSGKKFITYCELRDGQCAFVVHVPEYRKFEDDAKDSLAELAWTVAQRTAQEKLQPGDKLAVGLKGVVLYGSVMVGRVGEPDGEEPEPETSSDERADLLPFFEPQIASQPPLIELPDEAPTEPAPPTTEEEVE